MNLQRKLGYISGHEGLFAKKTAASALPAAYAAHGCAQYPLAGCRWACFAGVYRPHREIEHWYAKVIGKVHGACVRRYAQVKRAHEGRNLAQGKLAAQVCLRKAGTVRHFIAQFLLGLAAQKNRGQICRRKAHGQAVPKRPHPAFWLPRLLQAPIQRGAFPLVWGANAPQRQGWERVKDPAGAGRAQ